MDLDAEFPRPDDHPDVLQLAMYMQKIDALEFGAYVGGVVHPTWDESGVMGRADYLKDARRVLDAVQMLGWRKATL
jgi:hypothetical protein